MAPTSTTHSSKTAGAGGIGSKRLAIEGLENDAREAKKGLWVDPAPIPPLVYRKARRGQSLGLSDLVLVDAQTEGGASSRSRHSWELLNKTPHPLLQLLQVHSRPGE